MASKYTRMRVLLRAAERAPIQVPTLNVYDDMPLSTREKFDYRIPPKSSDQIDGLTELVDDGFMEQVPSHSLTHDCFVLTDKGLLYVAMLDETPYPVEVKTVKWVDPRK